MSGPQTSAALAGLRVVELSHIMAGPVCGRLLADLGADVVKVESADGGDPSRRYRPPEIAGESAAFVMLNRNKRGIALDLKSDAGRAAALRLLQRADVVIENFRAGTMERLGLGYEALRQENPGLVYCEISGFGRSGPWAERGGFDLIAQGLSGLMSLTGEGPGRPPVKCGVPVTDITAGILGAFGITAALHERARSGLGQRVDTSLFEAGIFQTLWQSAIALATGEAPGPLGSAHPLTAPYQAFETADGWINVGAASQAVWERLPRALEAPELLEDPRFADNAGRMRHLDQLVPLLAGRFRQRDTGDWLERLEAAGVPAGPVNDVVQMHANPQTRAREMVLSVPRSGDGSVETLGCPVKLSRSGSRIERGAPRLGEHTREVLAELAFSADEIESLIATGAAAAPEAG